MNTTQLIVLGLVIGVGIGAGYFFFANGFKGVETAHTNVLMADTTTPAQQQASTTTTTTTTTNTTTSTAPFSWDFKDVKKADDPYQYTQVSLVAGGTSHPVGTYQGSCKVVNANEKGLIGEYADSNELSPRVQCWFAGAGDEIGLFKSGTGYIVEVGELQEGIEGGAAFRGNFKATIPLK